MGTFVISVGCQAPWMSCLFASSNTKLQTSDWEFWLSKPCVKYNIIVVFWCRALKREKAHPSTCGSINTCRGSTQKRKRQCNWYCRYGCLFIQENTTSNTICIRIWTLCMEHHYSSIFQIAWTLSAYEMCPFSVKEGQSERTYSNSQFLYQEYL